MANSDCICCRGYRRQQRPVQLCLLELPTPFLSDLQARFAMARALLLNHFAGTWTTTNLRNYIAFQEQLCPSKQNTQTRAAGVLAVSFDDSTVDNKSLLAVAVTIVPTVVLSEACNVCKKACCSNCTVGNQRKSCKNAFAMNGLSIHMLHTVHIQNSPPLGSTDLKIESIADRESYAAFFHGKQWTTLSWNCQHLSSQICKHASQWPRPCY